MRTRVKICGITRTCDLHQAVSAGADALGFVLYPRSKRAVSLEQAGTLIRQVPAWVSSVILTVNMDALPLKLAVQTLRPDLIQFHGDESPAICEGFNYPYLRALRVGGPGCETPEAVLRRTADYPNAKGFIFDAWSPAYGGSGLTFDLSLLSEVFAALPRQKIIIAGGLNADNVAGLITQHHPFGVDLSSGVEISPGFKSDQKMRSFFESVRQADQAAA